MVGEERLKAKQRQVNIYIVPKLFHIISFIYNGLSNIFYLNYTFISIAKHSYPADILYCSIF